MIGFTLCFISLIGFFVFDRYCLCVLCSLYLGFCWSSNQSDNTWIMPNRALTPIVFYSHGDWDTSVSVLTLLPYCGWDIGDWEPKNPGESPSGGSDSTLSRLPQPTLRRTQFHSQCCSLISTSSLVTPATPVENWYIPPVRLSPVFPDAYQRRCWFVAAWSVF